MNSWKTYLARWIPALEGARSRTQAQMMGSG